MVGSYRSWGRRIGQGGGRIGQGGGRIGHGGIV